MPAPPANVRISGQAAAPDCEADPLPVVNGPVTVSWDPVTHSHPDLGRRNVPLEVVKYEFVFEREEGEPLIFTADLPPNMTSVEIPSAFTDPGDEIKIGILVKEESGNQTAVESCFVMAE
jgi:hypothetical protein